MSTLRVDSLQGQTAGTDRYVVQVKQTVKTDKFSTTSATAVDVTGLSVDITPQSANNKVLVSCSLNYGGDTNFYGGVLLKRGSTTLSPTTAATGNQSVATFGVGGDNENFLYKVASASYQFLDSPNTTSATTYKIQIFSPYNSEPFTINAPNDDTNDTYIVKGTSTITVMEIAQ